MKKYPGIRMSQRTIAGVKCLFLWGTAFASTASAMPLSEYVADVVSVHPKVVQRVHSLILAKLVSRIVSKLCEAMESRIFRLMRTEGQTLAEKISKIGQAWGNRAAKSWAKDSGFIQYLTINSLSSFKT